ncbi:MAG TPA: hypothetical protein VF069_09480 [Streptosporangiaceae bacterium]
MADDDGDKPERPDPGNGGAADPGPQTDTNDADGGRREDDGHGGKKEIDEDPAGRRELERVRRIKVASLGPGDAFAGDKYIYNLRPPGTDDLWPVHKLTEAKQRELVDRFAGTPSRKRLIDLLGTEYVAVLQGRASTGRRTAALGALAHSSKTVAVIEGTHAPAALRPDDIEPRHGYVYDATEADWAGRLTEPALLGCQDMLARCDARLVVLVSPQADITAVVDRVVFHQPPSVMEVLYQHLRHALPDHKTDDIVRQVSLDLRLPADAARLAKALADGLARGLSVQDICASQPDPLRDEVRGLLRQEDRHQDLARRAFMIAWAVLDGVSAVDICRAAQALAESLFAEEARHKDQQLGLLPFGADLDQWLDYARHEPHDYASGLDRRLTSRPGFPHAVLDVVWFDYVVAHRPFLRWLEGLATGHDPVIRMKAARAVGRLAAHDLDYIDRSCFTPWSRDWSPALRQATAWAIEQVVWDRPQALGRMLERAVGWAKSDDLPEQSTAARLFGTLLGARDPARAMRGLRRIAATSGTEGLAPIVTRSVVEIFDWGVRAHVRGTPHVAGLEVQFRVVEELKDWTMSPFPVVRHLAAECLAELARLDAPERPPLLALCDAEPEPVTELWRRVLTSRTCGQEPWRALVAWSTNGLDFVSLRQRLEQEPEVRKKLRFYLDQRIDRLGVKGAME